MNITPLLIFAKNFNCLTKNKTSETHNKLRQFWKETIDKKEVWSLSSNRTKYHIFPSFPELFIRLFNVAKISIFWHKNYYKSINLEHQWKKLIFLYSYNENKVFPTVLWWQKPNCNAARLACKRKKSVSINVKKGEMLRESSHQNIHFSLHFSLLHQYTLDIKICCPSSIVVVWAPSIVGMGKIDNFSYR